MTMKARLKIEGTREEAFEALTAAQVRQKRAFDQHRGPNKRFNKGDIVAVRRKAIAIQGQAGKLSTLYRGPLQIGEKISDTLYVVESFETPPKYQVTAPIDQIKRWEIAEDVGSDEEWCESENSIV
uniref:Uncharacterized protein n=1 Tax=Strigamia maritima TaxID=126957 RepID=T1JFD8_STRMM